MTTNNRMELSGAIHGLKEIDLSSFLMGEKSELERITNNEQRITSIEVCTDSQYVQKGMTAWISGWIKNGWKSSTKKPVLNQDLWQALKKEEDRLKNEGVKVIWTHVPAHVGVTMNERADEIATACADASDLQLYRGAKKDYFFQA